MENEISQAIQIRFLGYVTEKDEAQKVITRLSEKDTVHYKGYDGIFYPYYSIYELEEYK